MELDCGDNSCLFATNKGGMRTNGGCRCIPPGNAKLSIKVQEILNASNAKDAEIARLTKENKILSLKVSGTLANNLCPDHRDKQSGKPCLACEIERLEKENAALREKVEQIRGAVDAACNFGLQNVLPGKIKQILGGEMMK
jgi:hypothetical protein